MGLGERYRKYWDPKSTSGCSGFLTQNFVKYRYKKIADKARKVCSLGITIEPNSDSSKCIFKCKTKLDNCLSQDSLAEFENNKCQDLAEAKTKHNELKKYETVMVPLNNKISERMAILKKNTPWRLKNRPEVKKLFTPSVTNCEKILYQNGYGDVKTDIAKKCPYGFTVGYKNNKCVLTKCSDVDNSTYSDIFEINLNQYLCKNASNKIVYKKSYLESGDCKKINTIGNDTESLTNKYSVNKDIIEKGIENNKNFVNTVCKPCELEKNSFCVSKPGSSKANRIEEIVVKEYDDHCKNNSKARKYEGNRYKKNKFINRFYESNYSCNYKKEWVDIGWSRCSPDCGNKRKRRKIFKCKNTNKGIIFSDKFCSQDKPVEVEKCDNADECSVPCTLGDWDIPDTNWSCPKKCGNKK